MSDYWHDLVNHKRNADPHCRELVAQIQEDIITYCDDIVHDIDYDFNEGNVDDLCQIVVNNYRTYIKKKNETR